MLGSHREKMQIELSGGDVVLAPHGAAHWLGDNADSPRVAGQQVVEAICSGRRVFPGEDISATLICGHFEIDKSVDHPFLRALPNFIHLAESEPHELSWLETITQIITQEVGSSQPGASIVVSRLAEAMFIQIIRAYMARRRPDSGFLAALRDERINSALSLMHSETEKTLKLEDIARHVGMSRSSFAARFRDLVQTSPMDYITGWRMELAKELLVNGRLSLVDVAERVGYMSESAFNRAFKRHFNQNPGAMRRQLLKTGNK